MKKLSYLIVLALILGLVLTGCSLLSDISQVPATEQTKAKPAGNPGAQTYAWHLHDDVMLPYGEPFDNMDILSSDTASKLIVNQPNGNTEVTITGVMNGLTQNTTYTVYLSNGYTKSKLDIRGTYKWLVTGRILQHDMIITTQNSDGTFSGTGGYPAGCYPYTLPGETAETITGQIMGDQINVTFTTTYSGPLNPGYVLTFSGTVGPDGSMSGKNMSNTWEWTTTEGHAKYVVASWPGYFNISSVPSVPAFKFTTDAYGSGSWHINLTDANFSGTGTHTLSVWINNEATATILISDTFDVTVD